MGYFEKCDPGLYCNHACSLKTESMVANGQPEIDRNSLKTTIPDVGKDETECPIKVGRLGYSGKMAFSNTLRI